MRHAFFPSLLSPELSSLGFLARVLANWQVDGDANVIPARAPLLVKAGLPT
jgi:hypothetical protein